MDTGNLYTITDKDGDIIVECASMREACKAINISRQYLATCANKKSLCFSKYYIIKIEREQLKEAPGAAPALGNFTMEQAVRWDKTMYGIRVKYGLDLSYWKEYKAKKAGK